MAGQFNSVTVLFRLLSEDNLTGTFEKVIGQQEKVQGAINRSTESYQKMNAAMKEAGMNKQQIAGVQTTLEKTDAETQKVNASLKTMQEQMRLVGADQNQIDKVTTSMVSSTMATNKSTSAMGRLKKGIGGIGLAAGAAFTVAGFYLSQWVESCLQAATTIQQQNMAIGGAMGLNATQSIAAGPTDTKYYNECNV